MTNTTEATSKAPLEAVDNLGMAEERIWGLFEILNALSEQTAVTPHLAWTVLQDELEAIANNVAQALEALGHENRYTTTAAE